MDIATVQEELDAYEGAIAYLDDRIGQLLEALRDRKLLDNTLVVITSDHGEEFGEHGVFEHSYSLYLPSVHVPLVISLPRAVPAGTRIDEPVSLRDISATVLDLIGIRSDDALPGASLVRHWDDDSTNGLTGEALLSELNHVAGQPDWFPVSKGNMKAVVQGGRRYIRNGDGMEELYDFDHDPAELDNLAGMEDEQQTLQRMKSILDMIVNP
jgi:arylsulfatase A-like enzyme